MIRALVLSAVLVLPGAQALAREAGLGPLMKLLRFSDTVAIMAEEGRAHGREIGQEMLSDFDERAWNETVARIYDPARMAATVSEEFALALDPAHIEPLIGYFGSDAGQRIVALEVAARSAFLDPQAEALARARYIEAREAGAPILARIAAIITDSDLINRNVEGALNSNLMFYDGLSDGGALEMTQGEVLRDVRGQRAETERDTREWLGAYLMLAYRPLASDTLEGYAALYRTPEGQALNRASFRAFNRMYDELAYLLGRAVASHLESSPL